MIFLWGSRALLELHACAAVRRRGFLLGKNDFYWVACFQEKESPPGVLAEATSQAPLGGVARALVFLGGMGFPLLFGLVGLSPTNIVFV
jgi:hypothetical protein